jgi:hypothetical protein
MRPMKVRGFEALGVISVVALLTPACGDDPKPGTGGATGGASGSGAGSGAGGSSSGGKGAGGGGRAGRGGQAGAGATAGEGGEAGDVTSATGGGAGRGGATSAGNGGHGGEGGTSGASGDAGGGGEGGDAPVGPVRDPRCDDATPSALQGSGSSQDPYLLCLPDQLLLIDSGPYGLDQRYALGDELDLDELAAPLSTFAMPFTGTLDGRSHAIANLPAALFTGVSADGLVHDLVVSGDVDASMETTGWGLLTRSNFGTVRRVRASGTLAVGDHVGILLGVNTGVVEDCSSSGAITSGGAHVGGLVGVNTGTVRRSFSTASVTATNRVGGLVGRQTEPGVIEESYALGNVTGTLSVGGLLGTFFGGTVRNSYARSGTVTAPEAGGLVGILSGTSGGSVYALVNSYAASTVAGTGAEGLVGMVEGTPPYDLTSSYFLDTATGTLGTQLSAEEMSTPSSFAGWDFDDVWKLDAAISSFPSLAFETP